jgi:nitrate reductase gamma subunit
MDRELDVTGESDSWKTKTMIAGAILGALAGIGAAYLLVYNAERHGTRVNVSMRDGLKLSLLLMGTLRQIAQLGDNE